MRSYFLKEMLKQLDMDYRRYFTWILRFGTLYPKRLSKLLLWMNSRPKSPTLQKLPSTDNLHFTLCLLTQTNVVWLRANGTLSGITNAVAMCISIKLTLSKNWPIWSGIFVIAVTVILNIQGINFWRTLKLNINIVDFYINVFHFTKKFLPLLTMQAFFFEIFYRTSPPPPVSSCLYSNELVNNRTIQIKLTAALLKNLQVCKKSIRILQN